MSLERITVLVDTILAMVGREIIRSLSGGLFTDEQIKNISGNVVGRYLIDLFPQPQEEIEAERRIAEAREHITAASRIIGDMKDDLESQTKQLDLLSNEIEEKKQLANRYSALISANEEQRAAFKAELEETVRQELIAQNERGKRLRQVISLSSWLITLVLGAALGAYFPNIIQWLF